jgi:branched-chain amino acid transport system ATP-binding protein
MGTAPLLELADVRARYGQVRALHGVSLAVEPGQVVAVLGPNGAGKTTTLRAVSGTVRKSGDIVFDGKRIGGRSPETIAALGVAHVPEGRGTFTELTVWENLRLGAYRRPRKSFQQDVKRVLQHFAWIEMRRDQQAGTLSGGEQQMLALARAIVQRPRLVMLDEPSLGLAPIVVGQIFEVLQTLVEEDGLSALVVEQNANLALANSARAYVLEAGRVALEGTSEELSKDESVRKSYLGY